METSWWMKQQVFKWESYFVRATVDFQQIAFLMKETSVRSRVNGGAAKSWQFWECLWIENLNPDWNHESVPNSDPYWMMQHDLRVEWYVHIAGWIQHNYLDCEWQGQITWFDPINHHIAHCHERVYMNSIKRAGYLDTYHFIVSSCDHSISYYLYSDVSIIIQFLL